MRVFQRHLRAIDPYGAEAERGRAHDVPSVRRNEHDLARLDAETIGDEGVDLRTRLIHAYRIDRKYGIAQRGDAGSLRRSLEHVRRAVGQNGDAPATHL